MKNKMAILSVLLVVIVLLSSCNINEDMMEEIDADKNQSGSAEVDDLMEEIDADINQFGSAEVDDFVFEELPDDDVIRAYFGDKDNFFAYLKQVSHGKEKYMQNRDGREMVYYTVGETILQSSPLEIKPVDENELLYIEISECMNPFADHFKYCYNYYYDFFGFEVKIPVDEYSDLLYSEGLEAYFKKINPYLPRTDSFDSEVWKNVKNITITIDGEQYDAILYIPQISAPNIQFVYGSNIVKFAFYNRTYTEKQMISLVEKMSIVPVDLK